uniref:Uracil permease n=1 Tax=Bionectria ochroleuca TaxID=29856 RepID=A0A8H7TUX6_BIOOC
MTLTSLRSRGSATLSAANKKLELRLTQPESWKLPKQHSSIAPPDVWTNADQDPIPPELRTWTEITFITYWYSDLVTISGWSAAGAILTAGLSATDAILITLTAGICNAIPTVLNGAIGSDLHVPFPIAVRASYGYWLSYFCVISRAILAMFWFGVQSMILAIWPSYAKVENTLPKSIGITTQGMVSYLIYWLVQTPLLLIPTHRLQLLFNAKAVLVTPMALAIVIWIAVKAGNQSSGFFYAPATVSDICYGGYTTLTVNIPDFSRFSKTKGANLWQLPAIPFFKTIVGIFGIVAAGAAKEVYGEALWNPIDIINKWQDNPGGRAAAFFVNISANGVSFANDIASIAPKWFNIRRGVILVSFLGGWALCPWIILASAKAFMRFMSAYAIFMAPIAGILTTDYWLIKRRKYNVPALYDPHGIYRFGWGGNWRALVTTVLIITPLLPALGHEVNPEGVPVPDGLQKLFKFNWIYGFVTSTVLYYTLNVVSPHRETLIPQVIHGDQPSIDGVKPDREVSEARTEGKIGEIEPV